MKTYRNKRSSSKKTRKIIFRVLFVILAAIIIAAATILLGHYLLDKANATPVSENNDSPDTEKQQTAVQSEFEITCTKAPSVNAVLINIEEEFDADKPVPVETDYNIGEPEDTASENFSDDSGETIVDQIDSLSEYYDTIIIKLFDGNDLIYKSKAVCDLIGMPYGEDDETFIKIRDTVEYAKTKNLRVCAYIPSSLNGKASASASSIDAAVAEELWKIGVNEVVPVITELDSLDIGYDDALIIQKYIKECRSSSPSGIMLGVELGQRYFLDQHYARILQLFVSSADFLCIDFDGESYLTQADAFTDISQKIASISGSFRLYNMRFIVTDSSIQRMAAEYTACSFAEISNLMIFAPLTPEELAYDTNASSDIPSDTENGDDIQPADTEETDNMNPYASTKEDYPDYNPDETDSPEDTERQWF